MNGEGVGEKVEGKSERIDAFYPHNISALIALPLTKVKQFGRPAGEERECEAAPIAHTSDVKIVSSVQSIVHFD